MLTILILAAGASSRMEGRDKLTLPVDGLPMLATMVLRAQATRAPVLVALPPDNPTRAAIVADCDGAPVTVRDAAHGMGVSIATATAARPRETSALMILPADMPALTRDDLVAMKEAWQTSPKTAILRAVSPDGHPGHPVIFPASCFEALEHLTGDHGAREVIKAHDGPVIDVPLPGTHALLDIDSPEDWTAFKGATQG
ncbi:MAG: nucleotidyltransferase family protein [Rhodobacteraceae bacterium]|nr:nucleotidyltransferase family protein [Paracoccaceae bacterium]